MNPTKPSSTTRARLVASPPSPCSYLPDLESTLIFLDPDVIPNKAMYSRLIDLGFRRSGSYLYRPGCAQCRACRPLRVLVDHFESNRTQRRCLQMNEDIVVNRLPAGLHPQHFELYQRYMSSRHTDGAMQTDSPLTYLEFLSTQWLDSIFYEFQLDGQVVAVAAVDPLNEGLSAVYTFFDPDQSKRSLGRFSVLWLVEEAQRLGLPYLYLGYWVTDCQKMTYKAEYKPFEALIDQKWTPHDQI